MTAALRFASLGSGSRGNATLVEAGNTRVLIDCGFSARECARRLARIGVEAASLDAILVTHEHGDHANGVAALSSRFDIPVYLSAGTHRAMDARGHFQGIRVERRRVLRGVAFSLGNLSITPVRVPHDAQEPCQYVFEVGEAKLGVLTDIGDYTPQVLAAYSGCDALLLESNHDVGMLRAGPYPPSLQARVGGEFGHLSNDQTVQLLRELDTSRLQALVLAHLSEKNNEVSLARRKAADALGWHESRIGVASQADGHGWVTVNAQQVRAAGHSGA